MADGYLISNNQNITSFWHTENKISVIADVNVFQHWEAYRIINKLPMNLNWIEFPIWHNRPKNSFVSRFAKTNNAMPQSKLEIIRCVNQFDISEYLELQDVQLLKETMEKYDDTYLSVMNVSETYETDENYIKLHNLNWFISDEFVNRAERRVLLFQFQNKKEHFMCYDLLCFLVSELRRLFIEYRCEIVFKNRIRLIQQKKCFKIMELSEPIFICTITRC